MLASTGEIRQGFLCPQCHQDMSNMEMLQAHFQSVHMKQPTSSSKGLLSLAKQKIKTVQNNFKSSTDPSKVYAQHFALEQNEPLLQPQTIGYSRSLEYQFQRLRKARVDQVSTHTGLLLFRLDQLISTSADLPRLSNTKERRKYEQETVVWMVDSLVSVCFACGKSFGLSRRKHHCRLDGFVICNQCSHFLPFSVARHLIHPDTSSQGLTHLTSITSMAPPDGSSKEDSLRVCSSCKKFLQRRYDRIGFDQTEKNPIFLQYEKIAHQRAAFESVYPQYSTVVDSLLNGYPTYQITDAQLLYRKITDCYQAIDSASQLIVKLVESSAETDQEDRSYQVRFTSLGRNIRMYCVDLLRNCAIKTRRLPKEDEIQRAQNERKQRLEAERLAQARVESSIPTKRLVSGWKPTIDRQLLQKTDECEPFAQQHYQVTEFIRQAEQAGRHEEAEILKRNLMELEKAMQMTRMNTNTSG